MNSLHNELLLSTQKYVSAMAACDLLVQWDRFNLLSKRIPENQHQRMCVEMERGPSSKTTRDMHNESTKWNQWSGSHSFIGKGKTQAGDT